MYRATRQEAAMLSIIAQSFRIATRTESPLVAAGTRLASHRADRRARDLWFWQGGPVRRNGVRDIE
jgi:hypothetical protein